MKLCALEKFFQTRIQPHPFRLWTFFWGSVVLIAGIYVAVNEWSFYRGVHFAGFPLPYEPHIPFFPPFIFVYAFHYFIPLFTFVFLLKHPSLFRYIAGFYLLAMIHNVFYLLYPVENTFRPALGDEGGVALSVCRLFYQIDRPYNLFPSMHVSTAAYSAIFLLKIGHRRGPLFLLFAFLIFCSTLFTKQHYLADGLMGIVIGYGVAYSTTRQTPSC